MPHRVLLDLLFHVLGTEIVAGANEAQGVGGAHRVSIRRHHGEQVALRLHVHGVEIAEQIDAG